MWKKFERKWKLNPSTSVRKMPLHKCVCLQEASIASKMRPKHTTVIQQNTWIHTSSFCNWFSYRNPCVKHRFFSMRRDFISLAYTNVINYRMWSSSDARAYPETCLHQKKIGIWSAISRQRIVGAIFFTSTITVET